MMRMSSTSRTGGRWASCTAQGRRAVSLLVALLVALCAGAASADPVPAEFGLQVQIDQGASTWIADESSLAASLDATTVGDVTTVELTAPMNVLGGGATIEDWSSSFDPDPFITNNFVVVNNSGVTQSYTVAVSAALAPAFLANTIVQSNLILSINDDDNSAGATVSSLVGVPVYEAFVNGGSELTFLDDPFSNSCTTPVDCALNGTTVGTVASQGFGPALATSIGVTISFDLSPGDSAAIQSRFEIVPEPGTAALLGLSVIGVAVLRRKARL